MESVVALFREPAQAQSALEALKARGFDRDHLGFALTDSVKENEIAQATGISPEAGAPAGAGSVINGAIMGALAGVAVTLPVWLILKGVTVTRIYESGALYGMLLAVIGGLALGGLFGALAGSDHGDYVRLLRNMGVPAGQAERFTQSVQAGNVMVIARDPSGERTDEALTLMRKFGALKLDEAVGGGQLQSERTEYTN